MRPKTHQLKGNKNKHAISPLYKSREVNKKTVYCSKCFETAKTLTQFLPGRQKPRKLSSGEQQNLTNFLFWIRKSYKENQSNYLFWIRKPYKKLYKVTQTNFPFRIRKPYKENQTNFPFWIRKSYKLSLSEWINVLPFIF